MKKYFNGFDITTILPFTTIQRIFNNREVKKNIGLNTDDENTFTVERMQLIVAASQWIADEAQSSGTAVTRLFNKARTIEDKVLPWIEQYSANNDGTPKSVIGIDETHLDTNDDTVENTSEPEEIELNDSSGNENPNINTPTQTADTSPSEPTNTNTIGGSGGNRNLPYFFQGIAYGNLDPNDATTHGVTAVCRELQLFSEKRLVSQYPIATTFLVRTIIEQSLIYYSKHHNIQGQNKLIWENIKDISKLSKIIENYKRNLANYITDATIRQHFTYLFGNYEDNIDPLNWVVHRPADFRLDSTTLVQLPQKGLLSLVNFLIS